ncbi:MAG: hypothetical protein HOQ03_00675 [Thermoleophilia bacterium]|nr:hypothetical protein [Thermoleophilia bacterium]
MHACRQCGGSIEDAFRYCPWCAAPQRRKLVEFFAGTGAEAGKALRVSRYRDEGHVRFSVWNEDGVAEAVVSVDDGEAMRLAGFLASSPALPPAPARGGAPPAA